MWGQMAMSLQDFFPLRKWWNIIYVQQASRTVLTTASSNQLSYRVGTINAEMPEKLKKIATIGNCKSVTFPEYPVVVI